MYKILKNCPLIPVLTVNTIEDGYQLAKLLGNKGYTTLEITLRTDNAIDVINALCSEFPELTIGAGTITTIDDFKSILDSKAQFAVSPRCPTPQHQRPHNLRLVLNHDDSSTNYLSK